MTLKELKEELKPHQYTLVIINYSDIVRLVDVVDEVDDFYWVCDKGNEMFHVSCAMNFIVLKGSLPDKDYNELVRVWNLNYKNFAV